MSDVDCLLCDADRDAGHLECRVCGHVFEPACSDPTGAASYFAGTGPTERPTATAVLPRRKRQIFAHLKP